MPSGSLVRQGGHKRSTTKFLQRSAPAPESQNRRIRQPGRTCRAARSKRRQSSSMARLQLSWSVLVLGKTPIIRTTQGILQDFRIVSSLGNARMARGSELRGVDLLKKLNRVSHFRYPFVIKALLGEFSSSHWASTDVCGQVYLIKLGEGTRSRVLVPFECLTHFLRTSIILISELCGKERASCHQAYKPSAHHAPKCKERPEFTARLACVLDTIRQPRRAAAVPTLCVLLLAVIFSQPNRRQGGGG